MEKILHNYKTTIPAIVIVFVSALDYYYPLPTNVKEAINTIATFLIGLGAKDFSNR
jgi:hypothetical protein